MELSNHINLADPVIRRALYETGRWSKMLGIISGIFLALGVLIVAAIFLVMPQEMNSAFLENPALAGMSSTYLIVLYSATMILGVLMSVLLFKFGSTLKGRGPSQQLSNSEINAAFSNFTSILKFYAIFSVLSLVGSLVMLVV
ncbi:MAG: hypothetical protein AB8F78_18335 [Saprospiraceae bacterium]